MIDREYRRRRHLRIPLRAPLILSDSGGVRWAETIDLGPGGAAILVNDWIAPRSDVALLFKASPGMSTSLPPRLPAIRAEVRWTLPAGVGPDGRHRYRMGLAFTAVPRSVVDHVAGLVSEEERKSRLPTVREPRRGRHD